MKKEINTVEDYIAEFPTDVQNKLKLVRNTILKNAPNAIESISYGMPAYKLNKKPLVYFGGFTKHIGFYATPTGHQKFEFQLSKYKQGKGSVQFPLNDELPISLIADMVVFRVNENTKP
ncbi:iron chaperone [Confluentibacter citreus]|uniref:iron chaperone n=1 Tax=Confluentibacter citreus TaxID=2007307 RepID=UPI000C28736A|nr:DUF1801 domain-containing protein [Confluentibacter citreus]